ncbi:hypothetical protein HUJ05_012493 [Dendroctonus ponderosae]|nr:hypothetical protein HUJ05_012493 [Dendroctonus ponderosae]
MGCAKMQKLRFTVSMKSLVVFCALLVMALAHDPHGLDSVHKECHNEVASQHYLCMAKGLHLVTPEGKVNVNGVKTHAGHVVSESAKIDQIAKECAVDHASTEETVNHLFKCLEEKHVLSLAGHVAPQHHH